jgi:hypothetical protein
MTTRQTYPDGAERPRAMRRVGPPPEREISSLGAVTRRS